MEDKGLLDHNKNATAEKEKQDEKEKNAADESTEIEDKSLLCGWRSFRPGFLQKLVNPKWFILFLSIFSFTQGKNGKKTICEVDNMCEN